MLDLSSGEEGGRDGVCSFVGLWAVWIGFGRYVNRPERERTLQCRQDLCASDTKTVEVEEKAKFGCMWRHDG